MFRYPLFIGISRASLLTGSASSFCDKVQQRAVLYQLFFAIS